MRSTCGRRPEHHRLRPGGAQVPDAVPVAHELPEQLADGAGRGRFETGHNLSRQWSDGEAGGQGRGGIQTLTEPDGAPTPFPAPTWSALGARC